MWTVNRFTKLYSKFFFFFLKYCCLNKQKSSLSVISVSVLDTCVGGGVWVRVHLFVCVRVRCPQECPCSSETKSRIGPGFAETWRLAGLRAPGALLSSPLQVWGHRPAPRCLLFFKVLSWGILLVMPSPLQRARAQLLLSGFLNERWQLTSRSPFCDLLGFLEMQASTRGMGDIS